MAEHQKDAERSPKRRGVPGILWFLLGVAGLLLLYIAYSGWLRTTCIDKATQDYSFGANEVGVFKHPARSGERLNEELYQQCMGTTQ